MQLSFLDHPFSKHPKHVLIICLFDDAWLLTKHKNRGLEFPGGNVEDGETAEEAAYREVMEETGGLVEQLTYVGQYKVSGKKRTIIKNVYVARIEKLLDQDTYYETDGPQIIRQLPKNLMSNKQYSFIMKDNIVPKCLVQIEKEGIR